MARVRSLARISCISLVLLAGCSVGSAKKRYILAEKLWADGKYAASVAEFEKVAKKDAKGKLGLQALFRAAMTQTIFLGKHNQAILKFRKYVENTGDTPVSWSAEKQIGEILYSKVRRYEEAITHYEALVKHERAKKDAPEFFFRIAKSHFYLFRFTEAVEFYQQIVSQFKGTPQAERADFEVGTTLFTSGEQRPGGQGPGLEVYKKAIRAFQRFIKRYPASKLVPEARFGIAGCLEELDRLDEAFQAYQKLLNVYPSDQVIKIKLIRIGERINQKIR